MVSGPLAVMLWDHVGLVLGGEDEIDCAVRWIKGDKIGLEFAHETRLDCNEEMRDELLRAVIRKSFPDIKAIRFTIHSAGPRMTPKPMPRTSSGGGPNAIRQSGTASFITIMRSSPSGCATSR